MKGLGQGRLGYGRLGIGEEEQEPGRKIKVHSRRWRNEMIKRSPMAFKNILRYRPWQGE